MRFNAARTEEPGDIGYAILSNSKLIKEKAL
jgi:hypothetical protein